MKLLIEFAVLLAGWLSSGSYYKRYICGFWSSELCKQGTIMSLGYENRNSIIQLLYSSIIPILLLFLFYSFNIL